MNPIFFAMFKTANSVICSVSDMFNSRTSLESAFTTTLQYMFNLLLLLFINSSSIIIMRIRKIAKNRQLSSLRLSVCLSVRPQWTATSPLGVFSWNLSAFLNNRSRNFKIHFNLARVSGTLHEEQQTFWVISRSFLLWMRNVSDKICSEDQKNTFNVQ